MNVAADMAVWCHARAATGVRSMLLLLLSTMGVYPALHLVEYCSFRLTAAACMSAAFTCATFLSLLFLLLPITEG